VLASIDLVIHHYNHPLPQRDSSSTAKRLLSVCQVCRGGCYAVVICGKFGSEKRIPSDSKLSEQDEETWRGSIK
jgi:hypothetical protein